jgi:FtsP/CotA-like multicopper oxidase with cupredoxin domain
MASYRRTTPITRRRLLQAALPAAQCAFASGVSAQDKVGVRSFDLMVADGRLAAGPRSLRVRQGDTVELRWHTDRVSVIHLHGYDVETRTEPGAVAVMRFEARATGRFPVEMHAPSGRHVTLLYLEVHPR